jgi:N-acetylglucosamine kinase-like BadF-type ATPase
MSVVLGFDGGGTKTDCVVMEPSGKVLAAAQAGPSNPFRVGFGAALASLRDAASKALASSKLNESDAQAGAHAESRRSKSDVAAVCAGLAGVGQPVDAQKMKALLAAEFPAASIRICTDLELTLASAPPGPAIVLVAGTGSAAIGRRSNGEIERIGGHGPMVSDEGSAYDVGRRAVMTSLKEFDRTGKDTALGERVLREMGSLKWPELRKRIQAAPDEVFPRLFSVTAALADSGDKTAQDILRSAAYSLAALAASLAERLKLSEDSFHLVKTGGMIGKCKYFDTQLHERLRTILPYARTTQLRVPPAETAARMALELLKRSEAPRN